VIKVLSDTPVLFGDVDGDQHGDVIAPISVSGSGARTEHYAVFDGQSAVERARTPALPERRNALVAIVGRRLLLAQHDGQLAAYDLASGDLQWSTALGERVVALCKGKTEEAAHLTTDADRRLYLDLITGRQTPTREACKTLLARGESARDPRDRRDYQAPLEVESYSCGGVRVMGDQNYTVSDACLARAHVDSDKLEGMVGHRVWKQGTDWLVFGVRRPGAYVPMVGRLRRGHFVWKSEVPAENPLEAAEGGPRFTALAGDQLDIAYQSGRPARWSLTAFAAADGARRWTRALPEALRGNVHSLGAADDRVFVQADDALLFYDATRGELKATLGGPR
jgi:outer membrane protein assembly factor BamB